MVTFKANVYHEDNDNLIGAEVILYDGDTPIDSILITSKTSYDELVEEIHNLSSNYVGVRENSELSGQTIEDILSNSGNEITINASLLNGHSADYYAKASQISDLYNYDISLSSYNVVASSETPATVTATVKVTNAAGAAVSNMPVTLSINGDNYNGTTNSSGKFSMNYSTSETGLHTFSVKNQKIQLNVTGWETINVDIDGSTLKVNRSLKLARLYGTKSVKFDNIRSLPLGNIPSEFCPRGIVRQLAHSSIISPFIFIYISNNSAVELQTTSDNQTNTRNPDWDVLWAFE